MHFIVLYHVLDAFTIHVNALNYVGSLFLALSFVGALLQGRLANLPPGLRMWFWTVLVYGLLLFWYGVLKGHELRILWHDVTPYLHLSAFVVALDPRTWRNLDRMIFVQFVLILIATTYLWWLWGFEVSRERYAEVIFTEDYPILYRGWRLMVAWPYLLLTYPQAGKTRQVVTLLGVTAFFVLAVLFGKRMPFLHLAILGALVLASGWHPFRRRRRMAVRRRIIGAAVTMLTLAGTLVLASWFLQRMSAETGLTPLREMSIRLTRGGSILEAIRQDDRLTETPRRIVAQASDFELVFGQGLGSEVEREIPGEASYAVESGLWQFYFKGGVVFTLIWYGGFSVLLMDLLRRRRRQRRPFQLAAATVIIASPISSMFIGFPSTGYFLYWLGAALCGARGLRDVAFETSQGFARVATHVDTR